MDCSLRGSSVHGIFQARVLERVAISFSWGSSQPRDWTQVSRIAGRYSTFWATREAWPLLCVLCLVMQLFLTLCDHMDCSPPGSSVHGYSPGKNTEVGCSALHQGIFPTQGLNPGLLHCRQILYYLSHQGSLLYSNYTSIKNKLKKKEKRNDSS